MEKYSNAGFIGLGNMGGGMALHLLETVNTLYVYDNNPAAMDTLVSAGATACVSPAAVTAQCDIIFLCLPYTPAVKETLFGPDGIAAVVQEHLTLIDTTTLDRNDAISIAATAAEARITYCDCPVSGLPARAQDGSLTVMFGGDRQVFDDARGLLNCFGSDVRYCGSTGSGQAMKAINNVIYNINIVALCELLPLSVAIGLDAEQVASVVTSASARSFASEHFVSRMLERNFGGDFPMQGAYKDIVNVQGMAAEANAMIPVVEAMTASYKSAMEAGFGAEPKSAMLKIYEEVLGVTFEKNS